MTSDPEFGAYSLELCLFLRGWEGDPDLLSSELGVSPTRSWTKGEINPRTRGRGRYPFSGWILKSGVPSKESSVSAQLEGLGPLLDPVGDSMKRLPEGVDAIIECVCYAHDYWPGISFSPEQLLFIANLGATLEFDLYDLREE